MESIVIAVLEGSLSLLREIRVEGIIRNAEITGADEPVNVRDSTGTLRLNNASGRVRVIGFRGDVNTNTSDGDISVDGAFTAVVAQRFNAGFGVEYKGI